MKLFKLQNPLTIYVIAENEKQARLETANSDAGGEDYKKFVKTAERGIITEITSIDQVPEEDHDYVVFGGGRSNDYFGCSIAEFFEIKSDRSSK